MGKAVRKGTEVILTLSTEEAELMSAVLLEEGYYNFGAAEKATFVSLNQALTAQQPAARPYTCSVVGCYKFGHTFTEVGWNGDPKRGLKGHVEISRKHQVIED